MVWYDCRTALRTKRKCHVLNHLSCEIFHLSSPPSHFSPFLRRFLRKISKYIRKAAKWKSAPPRQVGLLLRRPIRTRPCSSRNKLKCAKAPCLREVSHTLVHFGEKNGTGTEAPMPVHSPISFCAVNPLTPGLPILRIFTEKGAPFPVGIEF